MDGTVETGVSSAAVGTGADETVEAGVDDDTGTGTGTGTVDGTDTEVLDGPQACVQFRAV